MKLLLIDSRVEWQGLADARKGDVEFLLFDFATASYSSLVATIAAKQVLYTDIALAQHSAQHSKQGDSVVITAAEGAVFGSPASVAALQTFLGGLKTVAPALKNFDFLGCRVFTEDLRPVFETLESLTGVHLRASATVTANPPTGNWVLESDGTDVAPVYFTDAITDWKGNLGGLYTYYRFITTRVQGRGQYCEIGELYLYGESTTDVTSVLYPPTAMSDYTTVVSGEPYGDGTYIVSSSTEMAEMAPYNALNRDDPTQTWWRCADSPVVYSNTSGGSVPMIGAAVTLIGGPGGPAVAGEWLQIQFPTALEIFSMTMYNYDTTQQRFADRMTIVGSTDGVTWSMVAELSLTNTLIGGTYYSTSATIATVPSAPTAVVATPGNTAATVAFTAPYDGNSPISSFTAIATPGGALGSAVSTPVTVGGLDNSSTYTFAVYATNRVGDGPSSIASASIIVGIPSAPLNPTAATGDAQAIVSFDPPATDNGSAVTGYTVTASPGGATGTGAASPITVGPLNNGTTYTFTVTATNAAGTSPASTATTPLLVGRPEPPTALVATPGSSQVSVAFTPGADNGNAISVYTVTSSPGGFVGTGSSSPVVVTGLTNGVSYTFTATATNAVATSAVSDASAPVTPVGVPTAPQNLTATSAQNEVTVAFTPPANDGGYAITGYTAVASPGGASATGASSPLTVGTLTNGVTYTISVYATNTLGDGASATINKMAGDIPSAPTITSVTQAGDRALSIAFSAPSSDGGVAITSYTLRSQNGTQVIGTSTPVLLTNLNFIFYSFTLTATNAIGESLASSESSSVRPTYVANVDLNSTMQDVLRGETWTNAIIPRVISSSKIGGTNVRTARSAYNLSAPGFAPTSAGLFWTTYEGYFADNINWFLTATPTAVNSYTGSATGTTTNLNGGATFSGDSKSTEYVGYFLPSATGSWTFRVNSDDASYVWLGPNAVTGYTSANSDPKYPGAHGFGGPITGTAVTLTAGVYYPIRIQFGEAGGGEGILLEFTGPSVGWTSNGLGYYFNTGNVLSGGGTGGAGGGASFPTVTTTAMASILGLTATAGGNVTADGGATIFQRGVCWSTSPNPNKDFCAVSYATGTTGAFTVPLVGLSYNTTYYLRAFAANSVGASYGGQATFTTLFLPVVSTLSVTSITQTTLQSGGNISTTGGATVTTRGLVWDGSSSNPTILLPTKTVDSGSYAAGVFSVGPTQLLQGGSYFIRAYATTAVGTDYGQSVYVNMLAASTAWISTLRPSAWTGNTFTGGGQILSTGGVGVSTYEYGLLQGQSPMPEWHWAQILRFSTMSGILSSFTYTSTIGGLGRESTFYVRAYALNPAGIALGAQTSFTTLNIPRLSTLAMTYPPAASSIQTRQAFGFGNVVFSGGTTASGQAEQVTTRGIVWSPTISTPTVVLSTQSFITGGTVPTVTARYVRFVRTSSPTVINLAELEIYDQNGTAITTGRTATASSNYSNSYPASNIIDGDYTNFMHTNDDGVGNTWVQVDLGSDKLISRIVLYNRTSCCLERAIGLTLYVINNASTTVFTGQEISSSQASYEYLMASTAGSNFSTGLYATLMSSLTFSTLYYVRAFAQNSVGTNYGETWSFMTASPSTAIVSTIQPFAQLSTGTGFTSGGRVTDDSGVLISSQGVVWSLTPNPQYGSVSTFTVNGTNVGVGTYTSVISSLAISSLYYVRAYTSNVGGVGYGNQLAYWTYNVPQMSTPQISSISAISAWARDIMNHTGGVFPSTYGFAWNTEPTPLWNQHSTLVGLGTLSSFNSKMMGLNYSTTYYVRAYGINTVGIGYSPEVSFTTTEPTLPSVQTVSTAISTIGTVVMAYADLVNPDGGDYGFVWDLNPAPTIELSTQVTVGSGAGPYSTILTNMALSSLYYIRAFASNVVGLVYGNELTYLTHTVPTLSTNAISAITTRSAWSGGSIQNVGGGVLSTYGITFNTAPEPFVYQNSTLTGVGTLSSFVREMSSLLFSTTYYARSYAITTVGVGYGEELSFTTMEASTPTVSTIALVGAANARTAATGGAIPDDGGATITQRGVVWDVNPSPTVDLSTQQIDVFGGTSPFIANISTLSTNTLYYARAYASNAVGVTYGQDVSTLTNDFPALSTTEISTNIGSTTATALGYIVSTGRTAITSYGFAFSFLSTPTVLNSTIAGNGPTAAYTATISTLQPGSNYYIRSFGSNAVGISYGQETLFSTLATIPTVSTVSTSSFLAGGSSLVIASLLNTGGRDVTRRGLIWGTTSSLAVSTTREELGLFSTGLFSLYATGLASTSTYYMRAYAVNTIGSGYGQITALAASGGNNGAPNPLYYVDPLNSASYSGSGNTMTNLGSATVTSQLTGNSYSAANLGMTITAPNGYLQLSSLSNARTITMWYRLTTTNGYILDARNGLANGYIWPGDVGSDWRNTAYYNDSAGTLVTTTLASNSQGLFYTGRWLFFAIIAINNFTDDITFFARVSQNEGSSAVFGPIKIYNRVLTASEVMLDYNQFAARYGYSQASLAIRSNTTYTQSSVYGTNTAATNANMTNGSFTETSQTATNASSEYVRMDLKSVYNVSVVVIGSDFSNTLSGGWGKGYAENKNVQYSSDGLTWTTAFNTGTFTQGIQFYPVSFSARYIQIVNNGYIAITEFYAIAS